MGKTRASLFSVSFSPCVTWETVKLSVRIIWRYYNFFLVLEAYFGVWIYRGELHYFELLSMIKIFKCAVEVWLFYFLFKDLVNVHKKNGLKIAEGLLLTLILDLVMLIELTHKCRIIHGDVKPDNLLVTHMLVIIIIIIIIEFYSTLGKVAGNVQCNYQ